MVCKKPEHVDLINIRYDESDHYISPDDDRKCPADGSHENPVNRHQRRHHLGALGHPEK